VKISISHLDEDLENVYLVSCLREIWREFGWSVSVGARFDPDSDVCLLHHDVTTLNLRDVPQTPDACPVLNGRVLDISKRRFSGIRLSPSDNWGGPVIVKSNLNHFGGPEFARLPAVRKAILRNRERLASLNWRWARMLPDRTYPVLESMEEVPQWVWSREDLLVERFLPEREGDLYCLRGWLFFGSAHYGYRLFATDPLVKTGTMVRYEYLHDVPPELEEARARWNFDFGKFDYVMHDGKPILLDMNKTPTISGNGRSERMVRFARAIEEFVG